MKKISLITAFIVLLISCKQNLPALPPPSPAIVWDESNIKGDVKQISTLEEDYIGLKEEEFSSRDSRFSFVTTTKEYYLPSGLLSKRLTYEKDSTITKEIHCYYNEFEQLVQKDSILHRPKLDSTSYLYTYNSEGLTTKQEQYQNGKLWLVTEKEFNKRGEVVRNTIKNLRKDSTYVETSTYTYDSLGYVVQDIIHSDGIGLTVKISHSYDNRGRVAEEILTVEDKNGYVEEKAVKTYTYDDNNRLVAKDLNALNSFNHDYTEKYIYDEGGNVVEYALKNPIAGSSKYRYAYDEKGNWISCIKHGYFGTTIRTRTITYY